MKLQQVVLGLTGVLALGFGSSLLFALVLPHGHEPPKKTRVQAGELEKPQPVAGTSTSRAAAPAGARGPTEPEDVARANLRSLLKRLAETTGVSRRRQLLAAVRARLEEFEEPLVEILENAHDPLLLAAIGLAGELRLERADSPLRLLALDSGAPELRAAAIRARERIEPWARPQLEAFLADPEPRVLEATLEILSGHDSRPVGKIIPLLGHAAIGVRRAAARAIPPLESGTDLDALCAFTVGSSGAATRAAAQALGRMAQTRQTVACLLALLQRKNWTVRTAALQALGQMRGKLEDTTAILHLLADKSHTVEERVFGFVVLERTGSVPVPRLEAMLDKLHPILRLGAARCLVTAGRRSGLQALVDLLDTEVAAKVDHEQRLRVRRSARAILAEVSHRDFGEDTKRWRQWLGTLGELAPTRLKTPPAISW